MLLDYMQSLADTNDFNGDGKSDILWRNTGGALVDWTMNGSQITAGQALTYQGNPVGLDSSWTVAGIGDFNGDGKSDILWRDTDGALVDWTMNGSQIHRWTGSDLPGQSGQPRLVLVRRRHRRLQWRRQVRHPLAQHRRRRVSLEFERRGRLHGRRFGSSRRPGRSPEPGISTAMDCPTSSGATATATRISGIRTARAASRAIDLGVVSTSWQTAGTGDFTGNGLSDIFWRNSDGDTYLWNSNGAGGFTGEELGVVSDELADRRDRGFHR